MLGGDGYEMLKNLKTESTGLETLDVIVTEYINKFGFKNIELGRIKNLHVMPVTQSDLESSTINPNKKAA